MSERLVISGGDVFDGTNNLAGQSLHELTP